MAKKARRTRTDSTPERNEYTPTGEIGQRRRVEMKFLTPKQRHYSKLIKGCDITFAIGSAGTGKTYLAALHAAESLLQEDVKKIVICRPAVNGGGEQLGFLPGTINEKMDPYIRPIIDALGEVFNPKQIANMIAYGRIEIVPLAFMRGRTFKESFIIADEMQNADDEQLLMLLTRLGDGSKMVITGDPTQKDIKGRACFETARRRLSNAKQISFVDFDVADVVRHPTVELVLRAWNPPPRVEEVPEEYGMNGSEIGHLPMFREMTETQITI